LLAALCPQKEPPQVASNHHFVHHLLRPERGLRPDATRCPVGEAGCGHRDGSVAGWASTVAGGG
jgi:hypothetical protein